MNHTSIEHADVTLVGAGIMSVTLAILLKELDPSLTIHLYETLGSEAQESSNAWNNAGTGHAALCEMNYTPEKADGTIDISQALKVNIEFDASRQLWAYLVKKGVIKDPRMFLHPEPHYSFVRGEENILFLKKRFEALTAYHNYQGMLYTEDKKRLKAWTPLIMEGRDASEAVAMTRMDTGTDVDYGALTRILLNSLKKEPGFSVNFLSQIKDLKQENQGWNVTVFNKKSKQTHHIHSKFVFIGAGGAALTLLQKSGIPESEGYAGFPVSGIWLRTDNEHIAARHPAKVYGKAAVGSPPMSMPHLDRRHIDGKISLLFGPFAGFSTKFLKHGSYWDFFRSIEFNNLLPLLAVGRDDLKLTEYLIGQVLETHEERFNALREFYPLVNESDWRIAVAGQRVQIIKKDPVHGGILKFGTEIVMSSDNSLVALLGASPGASTATSIMIDVIERCFADKLSDTKTLAKIKKMLPSYGKSLIDDAELCKKIRLKTAKILNIHSV